MTKNFFSGNDLFKYDVLEEEKEAYKSFMPGAALATQKEPRGTQSLRDWDRNMIYYFINGKSVKQILLELNKSDPEKFKQIAYIDVADSDAKSKTRSTESVHFNDIAGLELFFNEYLLCKVKDKETKRFMGELLLDHLHQAGLPHVMSGLFAEKCMQKLSRLCIIGHPSIRVHFVPLVDGVKVKELNHYRHFTSPRYQLSLKPDTDDDLLYGIIYISKKEIEGKSYLTYTVVSPTKKVARDVVVQSSVSDTIDLTKLDLSNPELQKKIISAASKAGHIQLDELPRSAGRFQSLWKRLKNNGVEKKEAEEKTDAELKTEVLADTLQGLWKQYFIKLEGSASLTVTRTGDQFQKQVALHNLSISVPDSRFHDLFNEVSFLTWLKEKLTQFFSSPKIIQKATQINKGSGPLPESK